MVIDWVEINFFLLTVFCGNDLHSSVKMDRHVQLASAYSIEADRIILVGTADLAVYRIIVVGTAGLTCICQLTWGIVVPYPNFLTSLFRIKRFSNYSKCLFSTVKLKSPINKILSYFLENAFIVLDRLLIKNWFWLGHL